MIAIAILLIAVIMFRPSVTASTGGKVLAFVAFFLFPVGLALMGANEHMVRSEQTEFCLSCHIMEPYGRSLRITMHRMFPRLISRTRASPAMKPATPAIPIT